MIPATILSLLILLILLVERVSIVTLTRSPGGRQWVIDHPLLHPNAISLIRIPMGVISLALWRYGEAVGNPLLPKIALLWFAFWMITDITDGTIARNCGLATESGKWLDPLSDKCMYFPILIMFSIWGPIPKIWCLALILIDTMGQASRLLVQKKAANYFGKAKTALITTLLTLVALDRICSLPFISTPLIEYLTVSTTILALLSFYCKVVPDTWYANTLTLANFLCGLAAIYSILVDAHFVRAFILVFVGQFFDLFDGRMATKFGSTAHGAFFDDVADATSFGGAISLLIAYQFGNSPLFSILAIVYFACMVYRLYRFLHPTASLPDGTFQGLPAPAGAMLAGSSALLFAQLWPIALVLIVATCLLMVCPMRYRHFGRRIWPKLPNGMRLLLVILFLLFVNMSIADRSYLDSFKLFCFSMSCIYVIYGIDYQAYRKSVGVTPTN